MSTPYCVVTITAPKGAKAKTLAKQIVRDRLAACVNLVPFIHSTYWWKGKVVEEGESLLILKTRRSKVKSLIQKVKKIHPYDVPEIIATPILQGHKPYLDWIKKETGKVN